VRTPGPRSACSTARRSGRFSHLLAIPDNAVADDGEAGSTADVSAEVTCTGSSTSVTSGIVALTIAPHTGVLDVAPDAIEAGEAVVVSGTVCYGGQFDLFYGPAGDDWIGDANGPSNETTRTFETEIETDPDLPRWRVRVLRGLPRARPTTR
jgi:hypothetical protein